MNDQIPQLEAKLVRLTTMPDADLHQQLDLLNTLVQEYRHFDPQHAFRLSEQAYTLAQRIDYPQGKRLALMNLTIHHTHISPDYAEALAWSAQTFALLEAYPDPVVHARTLQCMHTIYRHTGDYPAAQQCLFQALALAREAGDLATQGLIANDLGVLYRYRGDYAESLQAYQDALAIAQTTGNVQRIALALNNLGDLLHRWGRIGEALAYLEQALALTRHHTIKILEPSVWDSLSEVYLTQQRYAEALDALHEARQISQTFDNQFEVVTFLRNSGRIYLAQEAWPAALDYLHQALQLAESINLRDELFLCHELLATIYEKLQEPTLALEHYKAFHRIKEALYNEQTDQRVKTLQIIHKTESARQEAAIYRLQNVELQAALDKVQLLSGLLPICSHCKKIRDDGGYWHDVVSYISEHSEAEFSHGICPDCVATVYPEIYQRRQANAAKTAPTKR